MTTKQKLISTLATTFSKKSRCMSDRHGREGKTQSKHLHITKSSEVLWTWPSLPWERTTSAEPKSSTPAYNKTSFVPQCPAAKERKDKNVPLFPAYPHHQENLGKQFLNDKNMPKDGIPSRADDTEQTFQKCKLRIKRCATSLFQKQTQRLSCPF